MNNEHVNGYDFDFLIGKSIKEVKDDKLICSDGTIITIETNDGCGGCSSGWSSIDLDKLAENNNVITNVVCKYDTDADGYGDDFKLFIYYEDNQINEIEGTDGYGNGYYGGGFYVTITNVEEVGE